jgi:hypothetical protein
MLAQHRQQRAALARRFADALLFTYPRSGHALARDFKWLGSHRYGILHLHGRDAAHLRRRAEAASALIGWPAPYADAAATPQADWPVQAEPVPALPDPPHPMIQGVRP